jgi:hypothetical protein
MNLMLAGARLLRNSQIGRMPKLLDDHLREADLNEAVGTLRRVKQFEQASSSLQRFASVQLRNFHLIQR